MEDFKWVDNVGNKVIVMANSIEDAENKIQTWRQDDSKYDCGKTKYTSKLKEIEFDNHNVARVGHGSNPRY